MTIITCLSLSFQISETYLRGLWLRHCFTWPWTLMVIKMRLQEWYKPYMMTVEGQLKKRKRRKAKSLVKITEKAIRARPKVMTKRLKSQHGMLKTYLVSSGKCILASIGIGYLKLSLRSKMRLSLIKRAFKSFYSFLINVSLKMFSFLFILLWSKDGPTLISN